MEEVSQNSFVFKLVDRQMTFFCLGKASSPSKKPYARLLHPLILIYWLVQNEFPFFVVRIPVAHPPSVSPPTAVNHAGTSDWSRCPSPGRSSPLWHFVQLKLPAVTAALGGLIESMCFFATSIWQDRNIHRFRKINPRYHAPMDGIAIPSRGNKEIDLLSQNNLHLAWRLVWLVQLASKKCNNPHL